MVVEAIFKAIHLAINTVPIKLGKVAIIQPATDNLVHVGMVS